MAKREFLQPLMHQVFQPAGLTQASQTEQPGVGAVNAGGNTYKDDGSTCEAIYLLVQLASATPPSNDQIEQGTYVDPDIREEDGDWTYQGVPGAIFDANNSPTPNKLYSLAKWSLFGQPQDPERHEQPFDVTGISWANPKPEPRNCYGVEIGQDTWLFTVYDIGDPHSGFRLMLDKNTPLKAKQIDVAAVSVDWTAYDPLTSAHITVFAGIAAPSSSLRFPITTKVGAILIYQVTDKTHAWPVTSGQFEAPDDIELASEHVPIRMSVNMPTYPWNNPKFPHYRCTGGYTLCIKKIQ